jgi:hypothetical protein
MAIKIYIETKFDKNEYDIFYSYNFNSSTSDFMKKINFHKSEEAQLRSIKEDVFCVDYAYFVGGKDGYNRDYYTKIVFIYNPNDNNYENGRFINKLFNKILLFLKNSDFKSSEINSLLKEHNGLDEKVKESLKKAKKQPETQKNSKKQLYLLLFVIAFCVIPIVFLAINTTTSDAIIQSNPDPKDIASSHKSLNENDVVKFHSEVTKKENTFEPINSISSKKGILKAGFFRNDFLKNDKHALTDKIDSMELFPKETTDYYVIFLDEKITVNRYKTSNQDFFYCNTYFNKNELEKRMENTVSFCNSKDISLYKEYFFTGSEASKYFSITINENTFFIFVTYK